MKIIIEKELEQWWGIEDILGDMKDASQEDKETAIIELLLEDTSALLHNATWRIED